MKKKLLLLFTLYFFSCNKIEYIEPQTPDKIFESFKGSVVLIASQYYYRLDLNGSSFYYSPGSDDKIYPNEESVLENLSFSTGTGFIISNNGEIITNNHVVNHIDENYKIELNILFEKLKNSIVENYQMYNDSIEQLKKYYQEEYDYLEYYHIDELKKKYSELELEKENLNNFYNKLNSVDIEDTTPTLVIHRLGIAYNDTFVEDFNDLQDCIVIKTSKNQNVDLALIQTKNKSFNRIPEKIFNFKDNNPNVLKNPSKNIERDIKKPVIINDDVFMIGFNRGFLLANTKQGIKSQFTSGKISQEGDGEKILYTIPTLEGSSGSPIVDKWGNLVGVNFAKLTNSQNFSFGVPVYEVKKFYEE